MAEELVRTVGRYGILRELGRGGMGVVFLARQLDLDRYVALKEMATFHAAEPMIARRFVRESRLAGSLTHANVVTVFDYFEHEGTAYIAMEWVERGSLRPYVGNMSLAQIGGVLEGVLAGLGAAEERSIVHRDLKPENLMVTKDGAVKIADFGIAKATQETRTSAYVTATGTTIGTPAYMAPEQAMARDIGGWTDLYSVGCIAYELFTGAPPFHDAETPMAMMLRHISEPLPPAAEVAEVDPAISSWIARLTAKDPRERPPSSAVASEDLEELLIDKLGPRWRREARLAEPPSGRSRSETSTFRSFVWDRTPAGVDEETMLAGIDVEGTGPDTGDELLTAVTRDSPPAPDVVTPPPAPPPGEPADEAAATTARIAGEPPDDAAQVGAPPDHAAATTARIAGEPPDSGAATTARLAGEPPDAGAATPARLAGEPPESGAMTAPPAGVSPGSGAATTARMAGEPAPDSAGEPPAADPRTSQLARAGGFALLATLLLPLVSSGPDRWNLFAAFSPLAALGAAVVTAGVARRPGPLPAGIMLGFGVLATSGALALVKFASERLDPVAVVLVLITLAGAVALTVAGARAAQPEPPVTADPGTLVLALVGGALATVALFVNYDGLSSLWSEVPERDSAEFFLLPAVGVAATLGGIVLLQARPRLAAGLLLATGLMLTLQFVGVLIAAWRAIGEVGEVRSAGVIGLLGGALVLAAGAYAARR